MIIVCGLSNAAYQREDGIYVVPLTAFKRLKVMKNREFARISLFFL